MLDDHRKRPFGARLHKRLRADPVYARLAAFAAAEWRLDQEGIPGNIAGSVVLRRDGAAAQV